jgi:hypothetical protein
MEWSACRYEKSKSATAHCFHDTALRRTYGEKLTCGAYWDLFDSQGEVCGACGGRPVRKKPSRDRPLPFEHLAVDYCHRTGIVRGLTHRDCARDLIDEWVDIILALPPERLGPVHLTPDDPLPRSGRATITRGMVAYVRNPPGAALGLVVPPEKVAEREARHEASRRREQERDTAPRPRPTRGRGARPRRKQTLAEARADEPTSHLALKLRGTCDCEECVTRRKVADGYGSDWEARRREQERLRAAHLEARRLERERRVAVERRRRRQVRALRSAAACLLALGVAVIGVDVVLEALGRALLAAAVLAGSAVAALGGGRAG